MMWGIDYAPDGSVWFTDETYDSIWKFSTVDEQYERLSYLLLMVILYLKNFELMVLKL